MAYRALEKVRRLNKEAYGIDGPIVPAQFDQIRVEEKDEDGTIHTKYQKITDLERLALLFLREDCEDLRFSEQYEACEDRMGKSLNSNQIPYNMEKDLDRLCFENAVHRFMESGRSKDAFDIYFCFLEMFLGEYGKTKKIIEMLSEFETNASSLLMKHRDHYSHSAYVFVMGLAFYHSSETFRKAYYSSYQNFIGANGEILSTKQEAQAACHFLKYWGLTALFHDIGYPFELSFEQVKSYFGNTIDYVPFVSYNLNNFENSKTTELLKKTDKMIDEFSLKYTEAVLKNISPILTDKERAKLEKKINGFVDILFGAGGCNGLEPFKCRASYEENCLAIIHYLDNFRDLVIQRRQEDFQRIRNLLPDYAGRNTDNLNEYLAAALFKNLGEDYAGFEDYVKYKNSATNKNSVDYQNYLFDVLAKKINPENFGGFIDHAYFSTIMLIECLFGIVSTDQLNEMYTNSFTAILMHNSLYKFSITNYKDDGENGFNQGKHFRMERHPLAFLLMLCDEIQCWDRTSYGQVSRGELHPFDCELRFDGDQISAKYIFDQKQFDAINVENGTYKKLKPNKDGTIEFLSDIEQIVSINGDTSFDESISRIGNISLIVSADLRVDRRYRGSFLSSSNYIHFYKFAVLLHQKNNIGKITEEEAERKFSELSLEYKINHLSRAKKFARYLNEIGCFYSDKPVDLECLYTFTKEFQDKMGPLEHERWCWEHYIMGWRYGEAYTKLSGNKEILKTVRECTKTHIDMPPEVSEENSIYSMEIGVRHYQKLSDEDKEKDTKSLNNFLSVLLKEDGIRIYRFK